MNKLYAIQFGDSWVVLSAKYGFIQPDFMIPGPYNVTFKRKASNPISVAELRDQVRDQRLGSFDRLIGLGGREYRAAEEGAFRGETCELLFPFAGLPLGMAMQATKRAIQLGSIESGP